jgi:kinesin family member C2/C3
MMLWKVSLKISKKSLATRHNKLIVMKGNVRVFFRCRPLIADEIEEGASTAIDFESAKDGELIVRGHVSSKKVFKFDSVFSPGEDQEKVLEKTAPFVTSVLDGFNVCIFACGQTGTDKTFTMEGIEGARGVNYRTLEEFFLDNQRKRGSLPV